MSDRLKPVDHSRTQKSTNVRLFKSRPDEGRLPHSSTPRPTPRRTPRATPGRWLQRAGFAAFRGGNALFGRLAPGLASRWAETLFLNPLRAATPARELWWSTDAEETWIELGDGSSVPAWRWGHGGRRVLLIHGWGGRGLQLAAFAAPLVEQGFEVWAYDAPGHGRAPRQRWSFPEHCDLAAAVVRALGGVEAVIAHSMGAGALVAALARDPSLPVARLVLLAPPTDGLAVLERFGRLTGLPWSTVDRMRRRLEARFDVRFAEMTPAPIDEAMQRPMLLIHDQDDREVPVGEGMALARAWPGATLRTTAGLGHNRLLSHPRTVEWAVRFLVDGAWEVDDRRGRAA